MARREAQIGTAGELVFLRFVDSEYHIVRSIDAYIGENGISTTPVEVNLGDTWMCGEAKGLVHTRFPTPT